MPKVSDDLLRAKKHKMVELPKYSKEKSKKTDTKKMFVVPLKTKKRSK